MEELITVIVPVYNVERYLVRCVESIQNQSYRNIEIILVDDGSPDCCPQMCDEFANKDKRIKVIHKKNGGQGFARNSALEIASGEYVAFIDSDDWISKDHIQNLYDQIKVYSADLAIGSYTAVDADYVQQVCTTSLALGVYEGQDITKRILLPLIGADKRFASDVQVNASSSMSLYSMKLIRDHGIQYISERQVVGEDLFFNLDICFRARKIVVVDESGYYYFDNSASTSRKYDKQRFLRTLEFRRVMGIYAEAFGLKKEAEKRIERSFLMKIRVLIRLIVTTEGMSRKEKIESIKSILDNEIVHEVLGSYPITFYIPAIRILMKLMYNKNVVSVYYLMRLREFARTREGWKRTLKIIGIGR